MEYEGGEELMIEKFYSIASAVIPGIKTIDGMLSAAVTGLDNGYARFNNVFVPEETPTPEVTLTPTPEVTPTRTPEVIPTPEPPPGPPTTGGRSAAIAGELSIVVGAAVCAALFVCGRRREA